MNFSMFVLIDKLRKFMLNRMKTILNMFSCVAGSTSSRIRFNGKKFCALNSLQYAVVTKCQYFLLMIKTSFGKTSQHDIANVNEAANVYSIIQNKCHIVNKAMA